ncbi:prefoldin subunit alpha [Methanolobus sp. ZRKC3]|uniref:prefoldin subunit alpha n=1 Tax=Methanolobus sp. ZRKC3 TaxID=3125786 RepID=UPI00325069D6
MVNTNEQDPRTLAMQHGELQKRAESVQQQMSMVQTSAQDCAKALATVEELTGIEEGAEIMVPVGSGSFVYANVSRIDNIVVNIGAGVSVERPLNDAKEILENRKAKLEKAFENMSNALAQIGQQMQSIESYLSSLQQPQGQPGIPPVSQ